MGPIGPVEGKMQLNSVARRRSFLVALALAPLWFISAVAVAGDDGYVLYLSQYLTGDYYFAKLEDTESANPPTISPDRLRFPRHFRGQVELGNADVYGRTIVFAARRTTDYDWDIYTGTIDVKRRRIRHISRIIRNVGARDEDPRFSWDGSQIVYKCSGNICVYSNSPSANPVVASWCELWGPAFDYSGFTITYTKRCGGRSSDRIWEFNTVTGEETPVSNIGGGPDRFAQYLEDGRIIYSHVDADTDTSSLWGHDYGNVSTFHDRTSSDDDPYPDKQDFNRIAFIGWQDGGYNLFMYRQMSNDSVRLSQGIPMLAPILFR